MTGEEQLSEIVQSVIDTYTDAGDISPTWVATRVMNKIKFPHKLHPLGYVGCHLEVRQMARGKLRRAFDPTEADSAQEDMFPETLQDRYPRVKQPGEEPAYALRDLLSDEDVQYNVDRMRRGGLALLKHADALEAWNRDRRSAA